MTIEAKQITTNTYLIKDNGFVVGMIYQENDKYISLTKHDSSQHDTFKDAKSIFGKKVKEILSSTLIEELEPSTIINGYPVKHDNISVVEEGNRPVYRRVKSIYVAGYWTIKYSEVWVSSFCPLLTTIETYPSNGPFKTELEMKSQIASNNKLGI